MIIYITGVTGFLGKELLRKCLKQLTLETIYCPIRHKYGHTGEERFITLYKKLNEEGIDTKKLAFIKPEDTIPSDTTVVIFNAFSVSFSKTICENIRDNVYPIINQIKQLTNHKIKHIMFISTAYVQPPRPHKLYKDVFSNGYSNKEIIDLYQTIYDDTITWKHIESQSQNKHFVQNTYIYSKILTENLCKIYCKEINIALTIIRPSQIIISANSIYGDGDMGPIGAVLRAFCNPLIRTLISNGTFNVIPVNYVSEVVINNLKPIDNFNVVYATCNETLTPIQVMKCINPSKRILVFKRNSLLCRISIMLELWFYRILVVFNRLSLQRYLLICLFYRDYVYFQNNSWNFEKKFTLAGIDILTLLKTYVTSNNLIK